MLRHWASFFWRGTNEWNPTLRWMTRVLCYYFILLALFYLYFVQKQHAQAPYIYNSF